jgi:hypothetical protein
MQGTRCKEHKEQDARNKMQGTHTELVCRGLVAGAEGNELNKKIAQIIKDLGE